MTSLAYLHSGNQLFVDDCFTEASEEFSHGINDITDGDAKSILTKFKMSTSDVEGVDENKFSELSIPALLFHLLKSRGSALLKIGEF